MIKSRRNLGMLETNKRNNFDPLKREAILALKKKITTAITLIYSGTFIVQKCRLLTWRTVPN